ncbi:MAG: hypothetical protein GVY04_04200 [Cyanobacteria bacterium]|jgi:hypothetical protein|nr:hypothetical protein [Cyanobacteria bacterium GSL.Bin1]
MLEAARSRISDWNPQLVREIKGRWKGRNLSIAVVASLLSQLLIYLGFRGELPSAVNRINRYCIGTPPVEELSAAQMHNPPNNYCLEDTAGNLMMNWQLWWLDLFTWLTAAFLIVLLAAGTYLLISDLAKEEESGTLNFVRLSPRSATNLLVGKILGVPILIYTVILLALPLHLVAGLAAEIPLTLILGFYLVVVASCAFFFSAALLYGLVTAGLGSFQAWLGTGIVLLFLWLATLGGYGNSLVSNDPSDWLALFYPGKALPYLIGQTPHSLDTIGYFNLKDAMTLHWYSFPVWNYASSAIALLMINYAWWTYWVWQGLNRRFHNAHATLLSKPKSYWFTGSVTVSLLGFMTLEDYSIVRNFQIFFAIELMVFLLLIIALSPHRQTLQDWARYRQQKNRKDTHNLVADLMRGDESPANGAIALNLLSNILIITPAVLFLPLGNDRISVFATVLSVSSAFLAYACIAQLVLLMKTQKRSIFAIIIVSSVMFIPTAVGGILELPQVLTFAFFPIATGPIVSTTGIGFTLLAQWVVIISCTLQLTRQLKQAGESNTKALFGNENLKRSILG